MTEEEIRKHRERLVGLYQERTDAEAAEPEQRKRKLSDIASDIAQNELMLRSYGVEP